jgi:hypothetical protein
MKIIQEIGISNFNAWSGAVETKQTIIDNNKENDFDSLIEELYPDGLTDTQLNDLLWFDEEWIFESLGICEDEEIAKRSDAVLRL